MGCLRGLYVKFKCTALEFPIIHGVVKPMGWVGLDFKGLDMALLWGPVVSNGDAIGGYM